MKKILLIGILGLIITLFTVTANSQTLYDYDFSTPDGWKFSKNITSGTRNSEDYDSSIHTTVSFSDGTMKVGGEFFAHKFFPEIYTTGVLEANFKMKRNGNFATVAFVSNARYVTSALYIDEAGVVNANHQYGQANYNGKALMKLLRREIEEWHDYTYRVDFDRRVAEVIVDGEKLDEFVFTPYDPDAFKLVFKEAEVKDFKLSRYYDVEIEKDGFSTENIYDEGKVTIKSVSPLPENAMFLTGVYRDDILVKVYQSDQAQFEINAQDGERIKVFLWGNDGLIPLTDGVVTADKIADVSNNGKNLLYNYEKENPNSGFKFDEISNQEMLDEENVELYERETPDGTKTLRHGEYEENIGVEGTWYASGTHEEKEQNLLDLANAAAKKYSDGYIVSITHPLYYLLTGDIAKAESLIAENAGEQYSFTNLTHYYMYFKYGHLLSDEAKENLKLSIKADYERSSVPSVGFQWDKGIRERITSSHNQLYDGLVRGIFYALAYMDDEVEGENAKKVFETCDIMIDKLVAATAFSGYAIGDYNSQCYGAATWAYALALADLLPEGSEQQIKAELLLNRMEAEIAILYHPQTAKTVAPYARSSFDLASGITVRQNFPMMLYGLSTREGYWQNNDTITYGFYYPQLAATTHKLKNYMESIVYDKEYPQNINISYGRNATKEAYKLDPGLQTLEGKDSVTKFSSTVGYMTENYTIGSVPEPAWYMPGLRGEDVSFLARWTRDNTPDSLADIPALFSYYRYDIGREATGSNHVNQGLTATAQYKNKAIIYLYPGKVTDENLAAKLGVSDYANGLSFYNMGISIYITNPEDTKIYVDDKKIADEEIIAVSGNKELRAKLDNLPYTAENPSGNIYIEDKNIYAVIIPLNANKVEIRDFTADIENNSGDNGATTLAEGVYSINLLNYSGEKKNFTEAQRHSLRNGYIFEIAQKSEYASIDEFIEHIESSSFTTSESNNIWTTEYTSGGDTLKLCYDTENLYVTESYANNEAYKNVFTPCWIDGKHIYAADAATEDLYRWNKLDLYKENPTVFKSDNLIHSQATEIKIGDCILENPDEAMVYIIYSPKTKTYVVGDLTAGKNNYTLTTPYGKVKIDNLDLGYVEIESEELSTNILATDSAATAVVLK